MRQTVIDNARPRRFHAHFQFCYRQSKVFFADILFGIHRNVQAIGSRAHDFAFDFRAVLTHKIGGDGQFFKGDIGGQKGRNDRTAVCIGTLFKFGGKNFSNLEFGDHVPRHFKGERTAFGRLLFTVQKKAIETEPLFDIIVHGNFIAALCRRGIADQCSALYRRVGHDMIDVRIHFERKALHFAHIAGGIYRRNLQVIFTVRDVKRIFACGQFTACVRRRAAVQRIDNLFGTDTFGRRPIDTDGEIIGMNPTADVLGKSDLGAVGRRLIDSRNRFRGCGTARISHIVHGFQRKTDAVVGNFDGIDEFFCVLGLAGNNLFAVDFEIIDAGLLVFDRHGQHLIFVVEPVRRRGNRIRNRRRGAVRRGERNLGIPHVHDVGTGVGVD